MSNDPNLLAKALVEVKSTWHDWNSSPVPGDDALPTTSGEQEEEDDLDYYGSGPTTSLPPNVKGFMETAFSKCITRVRRRKLSLKYPRPDTPSAKVPKLDTVFKGALAGEGTAKSDQDLAKIQACLSCLRTDSESMGTPRLTGFQGKCRRVHSNRGRP